jgi:hypothetical protein
MNLVLDNLNEPEILEQAYRNSPQEFSVKINEAIEKNTEPETLKVWNDIWSLIVSVQMKCLLNKPDCWCHISFHLNF